MFSFSVSTMLLMLTLCLLSLLLGSAFGELDADRRHALLCVYVLLVAVLSKCIRPTTNAASVRQIIDRNINSVWYDGINNQRQVIIVVTALSDLFIMAAVTASLLDFDCLPLDGPRAGVGYATARAQVAQIC
jgi:hypothetical protein